MSAIVIIGFAEALSAPEVAWSLVDEGMTVVAFARSGSHPALRYSRYVTLFEITPPEENVTASLADLETSLQALRRKYTQEAIALMPLDDAAVWLCGRVNPNLGMSIIGPQGESTALALDKWQQIQKAIEAGFFVPSSRYVENRRDIFQGPLNFPLIIKPAMALATRGEHLLKGHVWICSDAEELNCAVKQWDEQYPIILQQFIIGKGEGIFGLATEDGVIGWSAHRRLRMMNPQGSGSSACASKEPETGPRIACERFVAECGWHGLFMIELLRDDSGKAWFMELNGRAWGSMALARRAGFEYPAWAARRTLMRNASITPPQPGSGPLVCRHLGRELLHLLYSMRGPKSKALTRWPSPLTALRETLHFSRRDCWYNWRADDRKVFFSDLFLTIRSQCIKAKT